MMLLYGNEKWILQPGPPFIHPMDRPVMLPRPPGFDGIISGLQVSVVGGDLLGTLPVMGTEDGWQADLSSLTLPSYPYRLVPLELRAVEGPAWRLAVTGGQAPAGFPRCRVEQVHGAPRMTVNGRSLGAMCGYVTSFLGEFPPHAFDSVASMARAGIRLFQPVAHTAACIRDGAVDVGGCVDALIADAVILSLIAGDALCLVRWELHLPLSLVDAHPEEAIHDENGVMDIPLGHPHGRHASYASSLFRAINGEVLRQVIGALAASPVADRFVGIQLCYGNCGEWNNWGYHEEKFPDFSQPMQQAFGQWLLDRYGEKAFEGIPDPRRPVPTAARRLMDPPPFRDEARRDVIRFYEFWQQYTADTIAHFAGIVRQASGGAWLTGAFYGYYLGHYHTARGPYHFQDSGHYALRALADCPHIDFLAAPYPYTNRLKNGPINMAAGTCRHRGVVSLSENDQRTHHSGEANRIYGTTSSLLESIEIAKRDFINNLSKGCSYYFFDFHGGWYADPEFSDALVRLWEIEDLYEAHYAEAPRPDKVLVFVSEQSVPWMSCHPARFTREVSEMLLFELDAAGAPWELHTVDDLVDMDLCDCRLAILPNAYYLSQAQRKAITERLYRPGRTVLYCAMPGVLSEEGLCRDGFDLPGGLDFRKALTPHILSEAFIKGDFADGPLTGDDLRFAYRLLDEVPRSAFTADCLSEARVGDCRVLLSPFIALDRRGLRTVYDCAGIHVYSRNDDMFYMDGPLMGLYTRCGGTKTIILPRPVPLIYEAFTGQVIARDTDHFTFKPPRDIYTALFYAGPQI